MRYLELQEEKKLHDAGAKLIDDEMKRLKALILADMGTSPCAVSDDGCTIAWKPSYTTGIMKEELERQKAVHPDIYTEYVTTSERRRFNIKRPKPEAA